MVPLGFLHSLMVQPNGTMSLLKSWLMDALRASRYDIFGVIPRVHLLSTFCVGRI